MKYCDKLMVFLSIFILINSTFVNTMHDRESVVLYSSLHEWPDYFIKEQALHHTGKILLTTLLVICQKDAGIQKIKIDETIAAIEELIENPPYLEVQSNLLTLYKCTQKFITMTEEMLNSINQRTSFEQLEHWKEVRTLTIKEIKKLSQLKKNKDEYILLQSSEQPATPLIQPIRQPWYKSSPAWFLYGSASTMIIVYAANKLIGAFFS